MSNNAEEWALKQGHKRELKPKVRFPEFRNAPAWKNEAMGEMYSFKGTNSFSRDQLNYESGTVKDIHYGDIHTRYPSSFDICKEKVPFINPSESLETIRPDNYCVEGDVIFADASEDLEDVGKSIEIVALNDERLLSGMHTILARQERKILIIGFGGHLFKSARIRNQIKKEAQGAKVFGVSPTRLSNIDICYPLEKAEQQKITTCLTSLDELIDAHGQKLDALKAHKKGLTQQLFPGDGENRPRLRFPAFQNAGEWLASSVGKLVEAGCLYPPKDGNHGNLHPKSSDFVAKGIPFIMASDLNSGQIDTSNCHFITKALADTLQKGFAKEGDILLSHKGTVGEVAAVKRISTPYLMLTPQVTYYRVKDQTRLSNSFLAQLFVTDEFQRNLQNAAGGGTRAYIGITEQGKLGVNLPPEVPEQLAIADCLSSLDDLIVAQTQKLEALKTHKKGLMQQLFPPGEEVDA